MALFDKVKQAAAAAKDKVADFAEEKQLGEKFADIKDNVKKSWDETPSFGRLQTTGFVFWYLY